MQSQYARTRGQSNIGPSERILCVKKNDNGYCGRRGAASLFRLLYGSRSALKTLSCGELSKWTTAADAKRSTTLSCTGDLVKLLDQVRRAQVSRMLDIGCGYGGLTRFLAEFFSAGEFHGIDIDPDIQEEARSKGLTVHILNAETEPLPFPKGYFDLITCLGVLENMVSVDNILKETNRVLRDRGLCLFSMCNLGSWLNRLVLLLGYQPRDIEISSRISVGTHPAYSRAGGGITPTGHLHTVTTLAFRQLMEFYGFKQLALGAMRPEFDGTRVSAAFRIVDHVLSKRPSLGRRFLYLGTKSSET